MSVTFRHHEVSYEIEWDEEDEENETHKSHQYTSRSFDRERIHIKVPFVHFFLIFFSSKKDFHLLIKNTKQLDSWEKNKYKYIKVVSIRDVKKRAVFNALCVLYISFYELVKLLFKQV